ncbi:MAG TPA: hypothetical protein VFE98_00275 [Candidatus Bathyarchaeia archaeon]|nr:hypothetical protein [Candidatus Bathyarchaeia archaeon]
MRPSTGPREPAAIKVQIPRKLHQAIIRIQAQDNLDFTGACSKAALTIDSAQEEYKKMVLGEANKLAKSQ